MFPKKKGCCYCKISSDSYLLGELHTQEGVSVHLHCLYTSCTLRQRGIESGINGFLINDIKKDVKLCSKNKCTICHKPNASVQCARWTCIKFFHLLCLLESKGTVSYSDKFPCYCATHSKYQRIPPHIRREEQCCIICADRIEFQESKTNVVWGTCCRRRNLFHRECIQNYATNAGYSLRCPLCNDRSRFTKCLMTNGIFIPQREPLWEDESYFEESYFDKCSADKCLLSDGDDMMRCYGQLIKCGRCFSFTIHPGCAGVGPKEHFFCPSCQEVLNAEATLAKSQKKTCGAKICKYSGGRLKGSNKGPGKFMTCQMCSNMRIHQGCCRKNKWYCPTHEKFAPPELNSKAWHLP